MILAVPDTTDQMPIFEEAGTLPAIVKLPLLHCVISPPAFAVGAGLTTTVVLAASTSPQSDVNTTEYVPAIAAVAEGIDGSATFELNPLGPDQVKI